MSSRGFQPSPKLAVLMLFEKVEEYFAAKGLEEPRREVTEMRSNLGDQLIREQYGGGDG